VSAPQATPSPPGALLAEGLGYDTLASMLGNSLDGILVVDGERRIIYLNDAIVPMTGYARDELLGRDYLELIAPREQETMRARAGLPVPDDAPARYTVILAADGTEREIEYSNIVMPDGLEGTLSVAIIRDVTLSLRQAREAHVLAEIAASLAFDQPMTATLQGLAASVVKATRAVAAALILIEPDLSSIRFAGAHGLNPGFMAALERTWTSEFGLHSGRAVRSGVPQVGHGARRGMLSVERFRPLWHYLEAETWEDLIVAPVVYQDRPLGTITCYYMGDTPIDAAEVTLVGAIADQAAITLVNHELFQEAQGGAAIEERQRLARELHDSVSQALYGIALGARTARTLLDRDPAKVHEPLEYVLSLADTGLREMRALIFELRPESLAQEGLLAAIEEHSQALARRHQLMMRLDLEREPDLPLAEKEALYRIAQEAIHNVAKHAQATQVAVTLYTIDERVELIVADDGCGFDPALQYAGHLGLHSMRERATRLGGGLEIDSTPDQGTRVRAWLPSGATR